MGDHKYTSFPSGEKTGDLPLCGVKKGERSTADMGVLGAAGVAEDWAAVTEAARPVTIKHNNVDP